MKVGIISEYALHTVNFGNCLQAYALNSFLRNGLGIERVESIALGSKQMLRYTHMLSLGFASKIGHTLWDKTVGKASNNSASETVDLKNRLRKFEDFQQAHIPTCERQFFRNEICDTDYDAIVVGSDVVWRQCPLWISRTKFLDFEAEKPFRRIAYAASFGHDYIPKENVKYIRKYLSRFDAISVREHSSVTMLNGIGVQNVSYCLDPTLLLPVQEWEALEEKPEAIADGERYLFTYLLGGSACQRREIEAFAEKAGLKTVTVPHANGLFVEADGNYADVRLQDCSIGNWLWLIHHAQYVISDSFHGTVFSTIYNRPFVSLFREDTVDINNRLRDYLGQIGQTDKMLSEGRLLEMAGLTWDYGQIRAAIEERKQSSIAFLKNAFREHPKQNQETDR